jgi:hypothetical protein
MREIIDEVNRVSPLVASHGQQLQTPIPTFTQIQQALSAGGTNPLHTTGLPGSVSTGPSTPGNPNPPLANNNFVLGAGGNAIKDSGFAIVPIVQGGTGSASGFQEGTWTPGISFGGASVGVVYAAQVGNYLLITSSLGSWVWLTGTIILTNEGTSTGVLAVTGLPFNAINTPNAFISVSFHVENFQAISGHIQGKIAPGANTIAVYSVGSGSASQMNQADTTNSSIVILSVFYKVS